MCDITAEMPDTMDGILYQARNFRLSSGTGAAYLVQLLKHLPISIEVCNANLALTMSPLDRARMYLEDMVAVLNAAGESNDASDCAWMIRFYPRTLYES